MKRRKSDDVLSFSLSSPVDKLTGFPGLRYRYAICMRSFRFIPGSFWRKEGGIRHLEYVAISSRVRTDTETAI